MGRVVEHNEKTESASLVKVGYTVPSQVHQQEAGRCSVSQGGEIVNGQEG